MRYASQTEVPADRSRSEIEKTLNRYGAKQFVYGWMETQAMIGFSMNGRQIKFLIPMPDKDAKQFTESPTGRPRSVSQAEAEWEKATRQRWRALNLCIKAKLEAVESGISTFEEEFLAKIVVGPKGQTVGQWLLPQIDDVYAAKKLPPLLGGM